ncbi:hypothetical protein KCU66_g51, partial [Aureobasidium melanogenum]
MSTESLRRKRSNRSLVCNMGSPTVGDFGSQCNTSHQGFVNYFCSSRELKVRLAAVMTSTVHTKVSPQAMQM